jgi:TolB-like protein/DNA-binding winged helix-turn-helix (wHTH) protein
VRYQVGDLEIDVARRRVLRGAQALAITGISFDLLMALVRATPGLVSVGELMRLVWPGLVVSPETVSQRVKIVRRALGDDAGQARYIIGERGRGYRLVATVTALAEPDPGGGVPEVQPPRQVAGRSGVRIWYIGGALLMLLVAVLAILASRAPLPQSTPAAGTTAPAGTMASSAREAEPIATVAVLPFVNLTGDPAKDYLGDGMAEEIINVLAKVPGLKIPARTSSFAYKGRNVDARQIAKDLGVATLLEGSVREAGQRIRVTAELIDARDGLHRWSESYERQYTDLFALQDDLTSAIVQALKINLNGAAPVSIGRSPPTPDVIAYDLYLKGEAFMDRPTREGFERAAAYFQQALDRDPKFARALAMMGTAKMVSAGLGIQPLANLAAAESAGRRAMRLDPTLAEAHKVLGNVALARRQFLESELQGRTAIALDPNDATQHLAAGYRLDAVGHLREALAEQDTAVRLAPANLAVVQMRAIAASLLGHDADAIESARFAQDLGLPRQNFWQVDELAALRAHRYADAAAASVSGLDPQDPEQVRTAEVVRRVYAALADPSLRARALAARRELYPAPGSPHGGATTLERVSPCLQSSYYYALLGELDTAYELANQCLDRMAPGATVDGLWRLWQTGLERFRADARFPALAERLGLPAYWRVYGPPDECTASHGTFVCD